MGGSPLINSAILAGEFPIGYTGGGAIIASGLAGSDLIAIASPLPVLSIYGWAKPEIKSISEVRGKRIGVTRFGASSYFSARSMLESGGVKPTEVTFIQNGGVGESYAALQGSFEYYKDAFPASIRVIEKAMANALKFFDHPKAKEFDVKQSFDNSFVNEAMR